MSHEDTSQPSQSSDGEQGHHPIFGDDLSDPSLYGPSVPEHEWLTRPGASTEKYEDPVLTVDSLEVEQEAAEQQQREQVPAVRGLGRLAAFGNRLNRAANLIRTQRDELLSYAAFNRAGVKDNPNIEHDPPFNLASDPEAMALDLTVRWVQESRDPGQYPLSDQEIRRGLEYVIGARREAASEEERHQLADPQWSVLLQPAMVRALHDRVRQLAVSRNAMLPLPKKLNDEGYAKNTHPNDATRQYVLHETDRALARTGLRGISMRTPQILADYFGIKPSELWRPDKGVPEVVIDELDFRMRLDCVPVDSAGTTALDFLLPSGQERRRVLRLADERVTHRLESFQRALEAGEYPVHTIPAPGKLLALRSGAKAIEEFRRAAENMAASAPEDLSARSPREADAQREQEDEQQQSDLRWQRYDLWRMFDALPEDEKSGPAGQDLQNRIALINDALDRFQP